MIICRWDLLNEQLNGFISEEFGNDYLFAIKLSAPINLCINNVTWDIYNVYVVTHQETVFCKFRAGIIEQTECSMGGNLLTTSTSSQKVLTYTGYKYQNDFDNWIAHKSARNGLNHNANH